MVRVRTGLMGRCRPGSRGASRLQNCSIEETDEQVYRPLRLLVMLEQF